MHRVTLASTTLSDGPTAHETADAVERARRALRELCDRSPTAATGALVLQRWSGARRDEIRRLTIDCLDHYSN